MAKTPTAAPLLVRIPLPLKEWLDERAKLNNRSMNGEILALLKAEQGQSQKEGA